MVLKKRQNIFKKINLEKYEKYFLLPEATEKSEPSWFGFPILIKDNAPFSLLELNGYLFSHNVDTRPIFTGNITKQPYFKNKNFRVIGNLNNTDKMMERTFWIGVYPGLTVDMMEYVVKTIDDFIQSYEK